MVGKGQEISSPQTVKLITYIYCLNYIVLDYPVMCRIMSAVINLRVVIVPGELCCILKRGMY